ncbi:MAG: PEP-CTERM sorting domain-containing protein [Phycisphaerales bacterium]|nr:PEP-CTERM sorting domain-containing protein [Phycisphaerales bacterium]
MFKSTTLASAALLATVSCTAWMAAPSHAATLFSSDFSGVDNAQLSDSPDWADWTDDSPSYPILTTTTLDNQGYLTKSSAVTGAYKSVRAEISGSPAKFDPAQDLRYQIDLNRMYDTRSRTSENIYFIQYLTPDPTLAGEYVSMFVNYNKSSSPSASTINLYLQQRSAGGASTLWQPNLSGNGIELDDASPNTKMDLQMAIELRDDTGSNIRAGYQIVYNGVGQGWVYSNWFDATTGSDPFSDGWTTSWAGNTQLLLYTGGGYGTNGLAQTWIDNAIVTGTPVPEPTSLGLLTTAGLLALRRRR